MGWETGSESGSPGEGAAPAERGGDAGAGWRGLGGGAHGAGLKAGTELGPGAASWRRGVASSWSGVGGSGGCSAGEHVRDGEFGSGTPVGRSPVRGTSEPCVQGAATAAPARERKEAGQQGR